MNIIVNAELQAYIDPLTPDEHEALERSILSEGCRDALVLWGEVLVDGHNRYGICQQHGLPFQTVQNDGFRSMDDVHLWMINQHLGRRSVSDFQRGVLALRMRDIMAERRAQQTNQTQPAQTAAGDDAAQTLASQARNTPGTALTSREDIARAARLSSSQVSMIEKIQKQAAPELVAAVKSGHVSLYAAAAVASLPPEEQTAAALAGKEELKQAAKRVRDARRKPRDDLQAQDVSAPDRKTASTDDDSVAALQQQISALQAENQSLRQQLQALQAQLAQGAGLNPLHGPAF